MFHEIDQGLDRPRAWYGLTVVTSAKTEEEAVAIPEGTGLPFKRPTNDYVVGSDPGTTG